jgi:hypothetical protein
MYTELKMARGRKKLYDTQIRLPLSTEMLDAIDAVRFEDENRLGFIRVAIVMLMKLRRDIEKGVHNVRS